jgi:hypothetical protein
VTHDLPTAQKARRNPAGSPLKIAHDDDLIRVSTVYGDSPAGSTRNPKESQQTVPNDTQNVSLADDGETGNIHNLTFRNRSLHRRLAAAEESQRATLVLDALDVGAEVLARAAQHGDLDNLGLAVERLDQESKRIVAATVEHVDRTIEKTITEMAATIQGEDGPLAVLLEKFNPGVDGNVIDLFRDLVATTATKATKQAVKDIAEASQDTMDRLTKSMVLLEKVAAVEQARLAEAAKGTAKGLDHERDTESLLGELVAVAGDSLDDVSTVAGLEGNKKGDKTITPRGGCTIVTEEKCTARLSESKARALLDESMANRGAHLGMLIVEDESKVPGNQPFHFIDDDKVVVVADRLALRLVYALFRAKAIELAKVACGADDGAVTVAVDTIRQLVEDIKRTIERFRLLRTEHTKASKAIGQASRYVDDVAETLAESVAEIMAVIDALAIDPEGQVAA